MIVPETRYARSGRVTVAYQVVGDGPIDLVFVPGFLSHVEWNWEFAPFARFLSRLASFSRLIIFDKRGTGLSDPVDGQPGAEQRMDDIRAVMDGAGSERATLLGVFDGAPLAVQFAAQYPERTAALVLYAGLAKFTQDVEWHLGWSPAAIQLYLAASEDEWGSGEGAGLLAPSLADDESYRQWFARLARLAASPGSALALMRMNTDLDVRDLLPQVSCPTLLLHRTGDLVVDVTHSYALAEGIPGAQLVELPGADHWPWAGDADAVLGEIEEFVTGARSAPEPERVLTTLLFTDIVASTERASALGDRRWRELLEEHHALVRRELSRFRGREVKTTGDGFLASFDSPTRAIRCAAAVRSAMRPLGLDVRAGVHTGECEAIGDDLGGIHVHIGARVAGAAAPGEILVSGVVRELADGSAVHFEDRGLHELKGVARERHLYAAEVER